MVKVDAIEGTSDNALWYHYDVSNDVLYLRFASERETPTYAEEDDGGLIVLRRETDERRHRRINGSLQFRDERSH